MRRSKLEMNMDILRVLASNGPLRLTHVMHKANLNTSISRDFLQFLAKQELIEQQILVKRRNKKKVFYAITERGRSILRYFREFNSALQFPEEPHKIPSLLC